MATPIAALYPWESAPTVAAEDADLVAFHDEAREAWLDDWLADLFEEPAWLTDWLEDVETAVATVAAPGHVPFQSTDYYCPLTDEIGYAESVTPWLF